MSGIPADPATTRGPRPTPIASHSKRRWSNARADSPGGFIESASSTPRPVDIQSNSHVSRSLTPTGQREPTRSFVSLSYRAPPTPIDNAQYSRSIREDTAELANFALSETGSTHSTSPPQRRRVSQSHPESYFLNHDGAAENDVWHEEAIQEVSEPVTPVFAAPQNRLIGGSGLGNALRQTSWSTSSPEASTEDITQNTVQAHHGRHSETPQAPEPTSPRFDFQTSESTPLLSKDHHFMSPQPESLADGEDIEGQSKSWQQAGVLSRTKAKSAAFAKLAFTPKHWNKQALWQMVIVQPVKYLPAAVLGLLLNILDALSYGMILFPLGQPVFEKLGASGISIFYVSTIIAQLVYSCGASIFKGGIGSEMIEVVPFFHKMAFTILAKVGEEHPEAVIATTITSYAISSVLTGLVFFLMGACRFGYIVGFIPRHILIGCIGGVGWFLIATGFEVTARLNGNLNYDLDTLKQMFQADTAPLWILPLILAIALYWSQSRVSSKYYLPMYILAIPTIFYFFVLSLDELEPSSLRTNGWIFEGPEAGEPWWYFYTLYNFKIVRWDAIAETIPAMFALTFFGILHVPINVPSLAFSVGEDDVDLDRELVAHGLSNVLSGVAGSIQNYLVYSNSVLFMRTGADSRLAGIMLALLTIVVLVIGPVLIGFIPVMMVGVLIFVLGFELFIEAIWEPRKKLKVPEYLTVVAIVLIMGMYDFVAGIFVGIGLAFVSLVIQTSRVSAVRADYAGNVAGSTVRRNATQSRYLREVGQQIHITKLAGYLFFGTIVSVENRIRALLEDETFQARPIRFLIFDLNHVTGIDYSAAEAFNRLNRVFSRKGVTTSMSGVDSNGPLGRSLLAVGLGQEGNSVTLYTDLNSALESCENHLLKTLYLNREARTRHAPTRVLEMPMQKHEPSPTPTSIDCQFSSPRRNQLYMSATTALDAHPEPRYTNFKEPLRLILQTFQGLTTKNEDFWFRAVPYFKRCTFASSSTLFSRGSEAEGFYLLESGILRADYVLPQGQYFESIVAGTTCGELPFFSEERRTATVVAERDCVAWMLGREAWREMQEKDRETAVELLRVGLKLTGERMESITGYVLTTAG